MYNLYVGLSFGSGLLVLLAFFVLQWFHIPTGNLVDWLIGIASFWWLLVIVTVPWNIYFEAENIKSEAENSREKNIPVDAKKLAYVTQISRWSLVTAIALHVGSALGLYYLASTGVSFIGYISAFATLLLTFLRPAVRFYEYLARRLRAILQEIQYPREDILELRNRVRSLELQLSTMQIQLDPNREDSIISIHQREWQHIRQEQVKLRASLEQFQANNDLAHHHLAQNAETAIAQLNEDSQALNHVREIIRFWKNA